MSVSAPETPAAIAPRRRVCVPRAWAEIPEGAWVTVQEIVDYLRQGPNTVRKRADRGEWTHARPLLPPKDGQAKRVRWLVCKSCVDSPTGDCGRRR